MEIFICGLSNPFRVLFLPLNFDVNYKFLNYSLIKMRIKTQTKAKKNLLYVPINITSIKYLINPNSTLTYLYAFIYKKTQRGESGAKFTTALLKLYFIFITTIHYYLIFLFIAIYLPFITLLTTLIINKLFIIIQLIKLIIKHYKSFYNLFI